MDEKLVVDWLSTKTVNGEKVDRTEISSALSEASVMPCVCCFGDPDFLGMLAPDAGSIGGLPEDIERVLFYMICSACVKATPEDEIHEKVREFTLQLTN